jgi:hypothetical protein
MKATSIEMMKKTGKLPLSSWKLFWHFAVVSLLLIPSIILLVYTVKYIFGDESTTLTMLKRMMPLVCFSLTLAIILYIIQRRRLRFKIIQLRVDPNTFVSIAAKTAKEANWQIVEKTSSIIVAKTGFSWRSWGELITIVRDEDRVLFNSICDPDNMISIASWGRNISNFTDFKDRLMQETSK